MTALRMRFPNLVLFGRGTLQSLGEEARKLGTSRALIVTDPGVTAAGLVAPVRRALESAGIAVGVFDSVEPEPLTTGVEACANLALVERFDTLVGLGGGSAMDTAKAASALAVQGRSLADLYGADRVPGPGLTRILIPTTAGTGSEISGSCIFKDPTAGGLKRTLTSRHLLADLALVDPDLTNDLPPRITAETGMDVVTHAVESFTTWKANVLSDAWARQALVLAGRSLRDAYARGALAPQAREDLAMAAMISNAAAGLAGLGAVHGLAHPLSTVARVGHGRANAILLPVVMEFNLASRLDRFAEIAEILGEGAPGLGRAERAERAVRAVRCLRTDVGIVDGLGAYGVTADAAPTLADVARENYPVHLDANPRTVTRDDAIEIYRRAL
jgi:alcohol dehydrogenase